MSTIKGSGSRSGMKGSSKANQSGVASSKMRSTRVGKSTLGGAGRRRPSVDASTPAVFDPEDGSDRTPVPLTAAAVAAAAAQAAARAQAGGDNPGSVMVSGMGMNSQAMTSGMGLSSAVGSEINSSAQGSVQGSLGFSSQGAQSGAKSSHMSGSHFSSLGGSVLSQMSEGSQATGSHDGVSSLTRKQELPSAVEVMKAQQNAEIAQLKEEQLEVDQEIVLEETQMFMILDIKSVKCRNSDEATTATIEAQNEAYAGVKEMKITAADNYAQRGLKTTNPIMMTKTVQESAPSSHNSGFQACEWDIYDNFFDPNAEEEDEFGGEEEIKLPEGEAGTAVGDAATSQAAAQSQMSGDVSTMMGAASEMASEMNSMGMTSVGMSSMMQSQGQSIMVSGMGMAKATTTILPESLSDTMRVLERMVMQNIYAVNHLQYSGFDLPSELKEALAENEEKDEESEEEDEEEWSDDEEISYRLDSQWNFDCELTKGCNVSSLSWSKKSKYEHVLAVSYGETDFESAQKGGAILIWSLKNPDHPDHVIQTSSGVMCVAFSHTHCNLLAAGMYDGTVCVYDIGRRDTKPMMECIYTQKHTGPVWELRWVDQNSERGEKIASISSDGRITQWTMKKGLEHTDLFKLKKVPNPAKQKDVKSEAFISRNASGFCFDFSPADAELYICGTEEGNIHLCSRLYNHFLRTYIGHTEPVYKVKYCPAHPGIFISASADWTLKIWSTESSKSLMSIQPGNTPVMDVCWSPAKTTVFGATTADGKLLVWDLDQNATEPSAKFQLEDGSVHMNSLAFSEDSPVVMAGTSEGTVATFTIHGLSSAMSGGANVDPVKQLETILMMDKEAVVADEAAVEA